DYEFLKKLAKRNGYELYVLDRNMYFQPPGNDRAAVVSLEWGKGLVSFTPEINISEQVNKVEVRGWNVDKKEPFIGKAQQGDEPGRDPGRRSGAEMVNAAYPNGGKLNVRVPVHSQQDADRRAKALFKEKSETFVKGSGESIGIPEIRADQN